MSSIVSIISAHLKILRKACGSFGKRTLKDHLTEAENLLLKNKQDASEVKLLEPFFHAVKIDVIKYQVPAIDCYTAIFKSSPEIGFLHPSIVENILHSLFTIDRFQLEENRKKAAYCIYTCIVSKTGLIFVHSDLLRLSFLYLLKLHNSATESKKTIGEMIQDLVKRFIEQCNEPFPVLPFKTIQQAAKQVSSIICTHAIAIQEYIPHCPTSTIRDVDLIVIIRAFCSVIGKYGIQTTLISISVIQKILDLDAPFISKPFFVKELRTTIHVALLSLCVEGNLSLAQPVATMISTIWERFSSSYNEGLNEVLDKGIVTALDSPSTTTVIKTLRILSSLVEKPQFMIDTFVNYDCDKSGVFQNIFENTVNIVVKRAYPKQETEELQKEALKTMMNILKFLWKYFNELKDDNNKKLEEDEEVAQSLLSQKKEKNMIEKAQDIFKKSPNKGLLYFSSNNLCEDNPQSYADFLFNTPWVDPAGIGEVIGGSKPLNLAILPLFVQHFDFKGMSFETAFRAFLSKFQIPGESQMIDRVMQEFGLKYYNDNSNMFSCADTVYVLAFSTLMLHTDAHHPNVKHHMTLDEFIRNNRGIDDGNDLPTSFLEELYKGITSKKINLSANQSIPHISLLSQKQRAQLFKERISQALEVAKSRTTTELHQHRFHRAESPLLVGPMFECVWGGIHAALTMSFELTDDPDIISKCIEGFELCTHIASHCYLSKALDTLVDGFSTFARLRPYTPESRKPKNDQCMTALIKCALNDIKYLKGAWNIILEEFSALDKLSNQPKYSDNLKNIEYVYARSSSLDQESLKDFVKALCQVVGNALDETPTPHINMLSAIEQVATMNLAQKQPMIVWREIWPIMSKLFIKYGQSDNEQIWNKVLIIMNHIVKTFIEENETPQMHHKNMFMQPFYDIFELKQNKDLRTFILNYIQVFVEGYGDKLQSGWQSIIQVLISTAQEQGLIEFGLKILQKIASNSFDSVKQYRAEMFLTAVITYISHDFKGIIALPSVDLFPIIANRLNKDDTEIWIILFDSISKCHSPQSNKQVESSLEKNFISIVVNHGFPPSSNDLEETHESKEEREEEESTEQPHNKQEPTQSQESNNNVVDNYFGRDVWLHFLNSFLPSIFSLKETSDIKHLTQLLSTVYTSIFEKYAEKLLEYSKEILAFLQHCIMETTNVGMRHTALTCLESFVKNNSSTFDNQDLRSSLLEMLDTLVPEMIESCLFVQVLSKFVEIFTEDTQFANSFISILGKLSDTCSHERSKKGVLPTWCAVRESYFRCIVRQNREDEVVENLYQTLEFYHNLLKEGTLFSGWDTLVANCLNVTTSMETGLFIKCTQRSTEFICNLAEVEAENVRQELVPLLKRLLEVN